MSRRTCSISAGGASVGNSITIGSPDRREMTKMTMLAPMTLTSPCASLRRK